jgi:hypothetical protein
MYSGNGTLYWKNGDYFVGSFKDGVAVNEGIHYNSENKIKYKG